MLRDKLKKNIARITEPLSSLFSFLRLQVWILKFSVVYPNKLDGPVSNCRQLTPVQTGARVQKLSKLKVFFKCQNSYCFSSATGNSVLCDCSALCSLKPVVFLESISIYSV